LGRGGSFKRARIRRIKRNSTFGSTKQRESSAHGQGVTSGHDQAPARREEDGAGGGIPSKGAGGRREQGTVWAAQPSLNEGMEEKSKKGQKT